MGESGSFRVDGAVFLRMPVLPHHRAYALAAERDPGQGNERDELIRILRTVVADPLVREALEVSSDSWATGLRRLEEGEHVRTRQLRRATYAACRYLLRMTTRPTPFGLMAGVAVGSFDDEPLVELGKAHRKGVRPDGEWLTALLTEWESRTEVVRCLRVCANDLYFERAGRFVLPYVPLRDPTGQPAEEKSVRATPPARTAMTVARAPIAFTELVDRLVEQYPQAAGTDRVEQLLMGLIETGLLCTELSPPPHCTDPITYVRATLERTLAPETAGLGNIAARFDEYARAPLGSGRQAWGAATSEAHELHSGAGSPIQVDLRMDARITLPHTVAREVESAASVLLRLSPASGSPPHLANYYDEFLDRYGSGNAVPVKEVLDPERGIGPPAGYRLPANSRLGEPTQERDGPRNRKLAELASHALLSGSGEVVLDERTITELEPDTAVAPAADTAELSFQLLAESIEAIERGDFRLVSSPAMGLIAGGIFGRFAYLFEDGTALRDVMPPAADNVLRAQLAFQPAGGRQSNVMRVPTVTERTLAIGVFDERGQDSVLGVDDVGILAEAGSLSLVSLRDQRRINALSPQMLDSINRTPNVARLCREVTVAHTRPPRPWRWGDVDYLPYLPRVRYGRTVLAQARWRPSGELIEASADTSTWNTALDRWRERLRVPDTVQARHGDHSLELDLNAPLHRRLLADELRRKPELVITETARCGESDFDWLDGHANEIVVPLRAHRNESTVNRPARRAASWTPATARRSIPPGGEWVFAKLYADSALHHEILRDHLPSFLDSVDSGVDRWFFMRYADPDEHVRIRFHGRPEVLNQSLLPQLHSWTRVLHENGLIRKLALDSYEPEVNRYGGPEGIAAAEHAFRADSEAALAQLPLFDALNRDVPAEVLAAVNFVDLLRQTDPDWTSWYRRSDIQHYPGMHRHVSRAVQLTDALLAERQTDSDRMVTTIRAACQHRASTLQAYARALRTRDEPTPDRHRSIVNSLLHMHHNRLLGGNQDSEMRAHVVASRVAAAYKGRAKARQT